MATQETTLQQNPQTVALKKDPLLVKTRSLDKIFRIILIAINSVIVLPVVLAASIIVISGIVFPESQSATWVFALMLYPFVLTSILILIFDFALLTLYLMRNFKEYFRIKVKVAFLAWITIAIIVIYFLYTQFQPLTG